MLYLLAAFYGLLLGNYTTTAYFRIPRAININGLNNKIGKSPHCSTCGHKLKFYEYLPVLSWFSTKFRCNYCHAPTDPLYTILEVSVMLSSMLLMHIIGLNILYVTCVLVSASLALNLALLYSQHKVYPKAIYMLITTLLLVIVSILE